MDTYKVGVSVGEEHPLHRGGYPWLANSISPYDISSGRYRWLTLTGVSADLMSQIKSTGSLVGWDLCGVLADRLDEFPHEADDDQLRVLVVDFLRRTFECRGLPPLTEARGRR